MRTVLDPEAFRNKIKETIDEYVKDKKLSLNLEKGIFNYSLREANNHNVVKKWDNVYFVELYITRYRTIHQNIMNLKVMFVIYIHLKKLFNQQFLKKPFLNMKYIH